jgi:hypothetical protein
MTASEPARVLSRKSRQAKPAQVARVPSHVSLRETPPQQQALTRPIKRPTQASAYFLPTNENYVTLGKVNLLETFTPCNTDDSGCPSFSPMHAEFLASGFNKRNETPNLKNAAFNMELMNNGVIVRGGAVACDLLWSLYPRDWLEQQNHFIRENMDKNQSIKWALQRHVGIEYDDLADFETNKDENLILASLMQYAPKLPRDIHVWRGIAYGPTTEKADLEKLEQELREGTFIQNGLISTSLFSQVAISFTFINAIKFNPDEYALLMKIKVAANTPCLFMGRVPNESDWFLEESELVLPPGYLIVNSIQKQAPYGLFVDKKTGTFECQGRGITTLNCEWRPF